MSYDSRKLLRGQEFVQEVDIRIPCCKYVTGNYIVYNTVTTGSSTSINSSYTGSLTLVTGSGTNATSTWGTGTVYAQVAGTNEIMKISTLGANSLTIVARGQYGSTAASITGSVVLTIKHQGDVDFTCRDFPYTCSNSDSFDANSIKTLTFSSAQQASGLNRFAGLRKVNKSSGEVDPGESIGTRSSIKIEISDQVHSDYGIVSYPDRRSSNGTMFGKLLARNPYFNGLEILYREGFRDSGSYSLPDFKEELFIIDSANLSGGTFSINALDPLILTEDKKAQIPVSSAATLVLAMTGATTTFSYSNASNYYFGSMSSVIWVRIDSEVIKCTVSGATQLTVTQRGYRSTQKDHSAGATIQDCVVYQSTHGINIIRDMLINYTTIPAAYIGTYSGVISSLSSFTFSEVILHTPKPVKDLIDLFVKLGNLTFYFDTVNQDIVIDYVPETEIESIIIDQAIDIKSGSVAVDDNIKNQWTRVPILWAPYDVTSDSDEKFQFRYMPINTNVESQANLKSPNEKKITKFPILSESSSDSLIATSYASRVIESNYLPPRIINLTLDASKVGVVSGGNVSLGRIVSLATNESQDKDGNPISELYQVLRLNGDAFRGIQAKLKRYQLQTPSTIDYTISTNQINFNLASVFAPAAGTYTIYISPGVIIGSNTTSSPAFTTGSQSAGVEFIIINRGSILGMGGNGADAGIVSGTTYSPASDGGVGGDAFNATVNCTIDNGSGLIWSGGGGGGANNGYVEPMSIFVNAVGGTGAQGFGVSIGGFDVTHTISENNGSQSGAGIGLIMGGSWGEPGANGGGSWPGGGSNGGFSGYAIKSNGNVVTVSSGNNSISLRGRVS